MIFLTGTSQVGKTEYFNEFPNEVRGIPVFKEKMAASDIRAKMNPPNPSWEYLCTHEDAMILHQAQILSTYFSRIQERADFLSSIEKGIVLFERSVYDNLGYTYAFLQKFKEPNYESFGIHVNQARQVLERIEVSDEKIHICHVVERIKHYIPYNELNGIRPPTDIRLLCEQYLLQRRILNGIQKEDFTIDNYLDSL